MEVGMIAFLSSFEAADSRAVTKRVPTHTAPALMASAAAMPRSSKIPPAATSCTVFPVSGDLYWRQASIQAGFQILGNSINWPHSR